MQDTTLYESGERETGNLNILLAAEESAGIQTLKLLAEKRHNVAGVLTSPDGKQGTSGVAGLASRLNFPVLPSDKVRDPGFTSWVKTAKIDVLLNVHALYIIRPEIINAVRIGAFNLHPGPLPQYAGLNAPSWAIFRNEPSHAVTLHWMAPGVDTGDIAYESGFELGPQDTGLTVSTKCVQKGLPLIERLLEDLSNDPRMVPRRSQDLRKRQYFYRNRIPWNGVLPWARQAQELDAFVRACDYHPFTSPWGHPTTKRGEDEISVVKVSLSSESCSEPPGKVGPQDNEAVAVATGDNWLMVKRCRVNDGKYLAGAEVLQPGQHLSPVEPVE